MNPSYSNNEGHYLSHTDHNNPPYSEYHQDQQNVVTSTNNNNDAYEDINSFVNNFAHLHLINPNSSQNNLVGDLEITPGAMYNDSKYQQIVLPNGEPVLVNKLYKLPERNTTSLNGIHKRKRNRTVFSEAQIKILEAEYLSNRYLEQNRRKRLAEYLNLPEKIIKVWFQNRRMKDKKSPEENGTTNTNIFNVVQNGTSDVNIINVAPLHHAASQVTYGYIMNNGNNFVDINQEQYLPPNDDIPNLVNCNNVVPVTYEQNGLEGPMDVVNSNPVPLL